MKRPKIKLIDKSIKAQKPEDKRYFVQIEGYTGLMLRIKPSGEISFIYRYQADGRRRNITLGTYPMMTVAKVGKSYAEVRTMIDEGKDPLTEKETEEIRKQKAVNDPTVKQLGERYLENHNRKVKATTIREYRRYMEKSVFPKWGRRKANLITRADVIALIESAAKKAPIAANRLLNGPIKGMFTYAVNVGVLDTSPAARITPPAREVMKDRVLELDEIKRLWVALDHIEVHRDTRDTLRLILLTGCRPGEVIGMQIEHLAVDHWWNLPGAKTKSGRAHKVWLTDQARKIIEARLNDRLTGGGYVFPARGEVPHMRIDVLRTRVAKLHKTTSEGASLLKGAGVEYFTAHDLRRSAATGIARLGHAAVVPDILGHAPQTVTRQVYDQYGREPEIMRALTVWAEAIARAIDGIQADVIEINAMNK